MSTIYPGNYVCSLSGWAGQGVEAVPGGEFYSIKAYAKLDAAVGGTGAAVIALTVPSPDKREDDKVRPDKTPVVPGGSKVYRTSIRVYNLKAGANNGKIQVDGLTTGGLESTITAASNATAWADTAEIAYEGHAGAEVSTESADKTITVAVDKGAALVDATKPGYVFVEVCYQRSGPIPNFEDFGLAEPS